MLKCCEGGGIKMLRTPVHRLRDKGDVGYPEGGHDRVEGIESDTAGMGVGLGPLLGGGRGLVFGQTVDFVVQQQQGDVHVVTDGMDPVGGADGTAVPVTGDDDDVQVRAAELDPAGYRNRATVQPVHACTKNRCEAAKK